MAQARTLALLAGGSLVAAGFGIARLALPDKTAAQRSAEPTAAPRDDAELVRALAELREELRALREELERRDRPVSAAREVATADGSDSERLARVLEHLEGRLEGLGEVPAASAPPGRIVGAQGFASIADLQTKDRGVRTSSHLMWSLEDVLRRYGPPGEIFYKDGLLGLGYSKRTDAREVWFRLAEGVVIRVD